LRASLNAARARPSFAANQAIAIPLRNSSSGGCPEQTYAHVNESAVAEKTVLVKKKACFVKHRSRAVDKLVARVSNNYCSPIAC